MAPTRLPFAFDQERCPDGKFKPKEKPCDTTVATDDDEERVAKRLEERAALIGDSTDFVEAPASPNYSENYDAWKADLDENETGAIASWTDVNYRDIREAMLSGDTEGEWGQSAANLSRALARAPKVEGEIFRGMALSKSEVESLAKVGTTFTQKAHTSWSSEEEIACAFLFDEEDETKVPVLMVAENGRGVDMKPHSSVPHEAEVLAPAGEGFEVVAVEPIEVFGEMGFRVVVRRAA